jgi:hypothetical protein
VRLLGERVGDILRSAQDIRNEKSRWLSQVEALVPSASEFSMADVSSGLCMISGWLDGGECEGADDEDETRAQGRVSRERKCES